MIQVQRMLMRTLTTKTTSRRKVTRDIVARLIEARNASNGAEYQRLRTELMANLQGLVRHFACKYEHRGEPLDDLIQVGNLALLKAIDRFDGKRGVEFTSYAIPTILGEIKRHFRDKGWLIKVPRSLQDLKVNVTRATEALTQKLDRCPTPVEIARHLQKKPKDVLRARDLEGYHVFSLDSELPNGEAGPSAETLGTEDWRLDLVVDRVTLGGAFETLTSSERIVLESRFYEEASLTEIGRRYNLSKAHVFSIERGALQKLRAALGA